MTDGKHEFNLYDALQREARPDRRRWWEKQRYIIPLAMLVLAPAIWFVAGMVADTSAPAVQQTAASGQPREGVEPLPRAGTRAATPEAVEGGSAVGAAGSDVAVVASAGGTREGGAAGEGGGSAGDGAAGGAREDAGDAEAPAVCARILALRDDLDMRGVNPLQLYQDMRAIQQEAAGTGLAGTVDAAVAAMEGYASGQRTSEEVIAAGTALVVAC